MQAAALYAITAIVFFGLDFFGLKYLIRPVFLRHIGDLLVEGYRAGPAIVFYLFYIGGVVWFVSMPALREGSAGQALVNGAILGALAYGTYEFTNYATLKAWHWEMVAVDLAWGTALTAVAAAAGVAAVRAFS
jgi:uncharacterized membrane protein